MACSDGLPLGPGTALTMTLRYMHLAPSTLREAIGLLDDSGQPTGNAQSASL